MSEEVVVNIGEAVRRGGKKEQKFYFQDGRYRDKKRGPPTCNRTVAGGFLASTILLNVLMAVGVLFFHRITSAVVPGPNIWAEPLPCVVNVTEGYTYIAEDHVASKDYKYYFFTGKMTFAQAQKVCLGLPGEGTLLTILSRKQEEGIDKKIESLSDVDKPKSYIWSGDEDSVIKRQMWTGGYFDLDAESPMRVRWVNATGTETAYNNFCYPDQAYKLLLSLIDNWRKIGRQLGENPIVHIVKDYRPVSERKPGSGRAGCWQLHDPMSYEVEDATMYFACQTLKANEPYALALEFNGKFREVPGRRARDPLQARQYAAFAGIGSFAFARETCQKYGEGVTMISPRTLNLNEDIDRNVEEHGDKIFGEDLGYTNQKSLIWTGGFFNLSSPYPGKLRWLADPNSDKDIPTKRPILYWGQSKEKPFGYENFCGTSEYYYDLIDNAIMTERNASMTSGCVKGRIYVLVKDYRDAQAVQGCWHLYDLDFLYQNDYKLFLICELPTRVNSNPVSLHESEQVFKYDKSKNIDFRWTEDDDKFGS